MTGSTLEDIVSGECVPIFGPAPVCVHVWGLYVPRHTHLHVSCSHDAGTPSLHWATGWCTHSRGSSLRAIVRGSPSAGVADGVSERGRGNIGQWCHSSKNRAERLDTNAGQSRRSTSEAGALLYFYQHCFRLNLFLFDDKSGEATRFPAGCCQAGSHDHSHGTP